MEKLYNYHLGVTDLEFSLHLRATLDNLLLFQDLVSSSKPLAMQRKTSKDLGSFEDGFVLAWKTALHLRRDALQMNDTSVYTTKGLSAI